MRRRRILIAAGLLTIAALSAMDHAGVFGYQSTDRERYSGVEAKITNAVVFDTLEVDIPDKGSAVTRVRLHGIAPNPAEGKESERCNEEALAFIKSNVVGKRVTLALDPVRRTRDREGRLLAYIYLAESGELLNQTLIERGLADADRRAEHVLKFQLVEKAKRAAKGKVGLWARVERD